MFNKFSIIVGLVVVAVGISASPRVPRSVNFNATMNNVTYIRNDLFIGRREPGDWLLAQYPVYRGAIANRVVTQILNINAAYNLTLITSIDQAVNKTRGATVRLINGGPGSRNATLLFTSKIGQPIYHRVNAFGRR